MEDIPYEQFKKEFGYSSLIPLLIYVAGMYIMYLILKGSNSEAFLVMIFTFLVYVINNIFLNVKDSSSIFNEFLEDLAVFFTFGVNIMIFGIIFYKGDILILVTIIFFSICSVLGMARSWVLHLKNSVGFPISLNGLFFPLSYFLYSFYLQTPGNSVFIIYYLLVGGLAISKRNFVGYEEAIEEGIKNHMAENSSSNQNYNSNNYGNSNHNFQNNNYSNGNSNFNNGSQNHFNENLNYNNSNQQTNSNNNNNTINNNLSHTNNGNNYNN